MLSKTKIEKINKFLENKYFELPDDGDFTFKFKAEIIGTKKMISVGEWTVFAVVSFIVYDLGDTFKYVLKRSEDRFKSKNGVYNITNIFDHSLWVESRRMISEVVNVLQFVGIKHITIENVLVTKSEFIDYTPHEKLTESQKYRSAIRTLVKDVVDVLKNGETGEFYLPEDIKDEMVYSFINGPENVTVNLTIRDDESIDTFAVNGNYIKDDDTIEVLVVKNPKEKIKSMMYDIIGELNDLFAHELEHYRQYYAGELDTYDNEDDDENPKSLDYYTRPIELTAQVKGFNRLAKLQKRPFESVVKRWFETHKDIHNLNPKEQEFVISYILNLKKQVR
jgi:hypothetical protein